MGTMTQPPESGAPADPGRPYAPPGGQPPPYNQPPPNDQQPPYYRQPSYDQPPPYPPTSGQPPPYYQPPNYQPPNQPRFTPPQYLPSPGYEPPWAAPRPGCVPLRPLGVSDILDGSFRVIRRNPRATLGVSAVVAVVQTAVLAVFQLVIYRQFSGSTRISSDGSLTIDASRVITALSSAFSIVVLTAIFGAILTGMLTLVVTDDVLGRRMPLADLWQRTRPRLPRLIGLSFLIGLLQIVGLFFFVVPGVWLWGVLAVAVPAFMVEDLGVRAALRRSRRLVHGTFWRVWGIRALGVAVVSVVSSILAVPFSVIAALVSGESLSGISGSGGLPVAYVLITSIGSILATTFTAPVRAGIDALLYIDLRMRKEGLDLVLRERAAPGPRSQW